MLLFAAWLAVWLFSLLVFKKHPFGATLVLKLFRSFLFGWAALMILRCPTCPARGRRLAGLSLAGWSAYIALTSVVNVPFQPHLLFGLLAGFQVMSSLGLVVMAVDRMRLRAEESETRAERLEGLLPICSFCKRIRDEKKVWRSLESYMSERSGAEFSHSVCPECGRIHYPNVYDEGRGDE